MKVGLIYGGIGVEEVHNKKTLKEIIDVLDNYKIKHQNIYLNSTIKQRLLDSCDLFLVIDFNVLNYLQKFEIFKYIYDNNFDFIGQRDEICRILRDKHYTNFLLRSHGVSTPKSFISNINKKSQKYSYPVIIKDNYGSSSSDVYICDDYADVKKKVKILLSKNKAPLCENYIEGREFTCAYIRVCGIDLILDPLEIEYKGRIYDFETKNINLDNKLIVYPKLSKLLFKKIKIIVSQANRILNTQYYSRTDFKINNGNIILIEVNGEPVLAKDDFIARSLYKLGFEYKDLIFGLLANSSIFLNYIKKHRRELYSYIKKLEYRILQLSKNG